MSKRDWGVGFAFGLIAALAITLLLLVVAVPEFRNPVYQQDTQVTAYQRNSDEKPKERDQEQEWRHWAERLITLEDTAAQWLMAIFGVVATGVSVWAVLLVRDTLEVNRKATAAAVAAANAAHETNELTRAVQRPWLIVQPPRIGELTPVQNDFVDDVDYGETHYCFIGDICIPIINIGAIPATNVRVIAALIDRFITEEEENIKNTPWTMIELPSGKKVYNLGVRRFFEKYNSARLMKTGGIGQYIIGPGKTFEYRNWSIKNIRIRKALSHKPETDQSMVVTIGYQSPDKREIYESQFAFELCGLWVAGEMCPPSGPAFSEGESIFYRQAESDVK